MSTLGGPLVQRQSDSYGEWIKVFRHDSTGTIFFSSANDWEEAKKSNMGNTNSSKYSILYRWSSFLRSGKYTLKLVYPSLNITNIWSQTSNPVDTRTSPSGGVTGYVPISLQDSSQGWGGLERSGSNTFLDGTVNSGNWYYAVGSKSSYGGSDSYPGPNGSVKIVELWMLGQPI